MTVYSSMDRSQLTGRSPSAPRGARTGFSLAELLVVVGICVLLLSIFIPYLVKMREDDRRTRCNDNLREIGWALTNYARDNHGVFPRVRYDEVDRPSAFTAFTGPDANDPFAPDSAVEPNDVTASLWLLVRGGYIASSAFVCPSASDYPDQGLSAAGRAAQPAERGNFRHPRHLSYGYASPFSNAAQYGLTDSVAPGFALLADIGPTINAKHPMPPHNAGLLDLAEGNSSNHGGAGQWVLYSEMTTAFVTTPYAGIAGDNIYTAQAPSPIFGEHPPTPNVTGFQGRTIGPAWQTDSYLVPSRSTRP